MKFDDEFWRSFKQTFWPTFIITLLLGLSNILLGAWQTLNLFALFVLTAFVILPVIFSLPAEYNT